MNPLEAYSDTIPHIIPLLEDRTALVTGAGKGIGRSIALALASCGADVVIVSRTESDCNETADLGRSLKGSIKAFPADITSEESVAGIFKMIEDEYKGLDILINNAGVGIFGPIEEFSADDFSRIIDTNLKGTFLCCREGVHIMKARESGYIINIASVVGIKGYPDQAVYTASKHGIMGLTKSIAAETHSSHIRVSAVLPGGVDTEMAGQARPDLDRDVLLQPEDIAGTVLFLLSLPERAAIDQIYIRRSASSPF